MATAASRSEGSRIAAFSWLRSAALAIASAWAFASFAEKLRASMEQFEFTLPSGGSIHRTCSIGFAAFPFLPSDPRAIGWHEVVDLADKALYGVKHGGRNGWAGVRPADGATRADAVRRFLDKPAAALASRLIRVEASEKFGDDFRLS